MITQLLTQGSLSVCVRSSVPLGHDTSFPIPVVTLHLLMTQVYEFKSTLSPLVDHSIHPFLCLSLYLSTHMFSQPCPSVLFSAHISIHLFIRLSLCPFASYSLFVISSSHPSVIISTCLPSCSCLSIHSSILLPICLSPTLSSVYPMSIHQAFI